MMQPKAFFFGIITVPMYYFNCIMTNAQIDLIASDKAVNYMKKDKKGEKKNKKNLGKPTDEKVKAAIERYKALQHK